METLTGLYKNGDKLYRVEDHDQVFSQLSHNMRSEMVKRERLLHVTSVDGSGMSEDECPRVLEAVMPKNHKLLIINYEIQLRLDECHVTLVEVIPSGEWVKEDAIMDMYQMPTRYVVNRRDDGRIHQYLTGPSVGRLT